MPGSILGNAVRRVEDPRFLVGNSRYVPDLHVDGLLHLVLARSEVAHAMLERVELNGADKVPGVLRVYTGSDIERPPIPQPLWTLNPGCVRHLLARDRVRFVGDPI